MPKDEWRKSKNRQTAKRINREVAQEREIQEALWDARHFGEGSDKLASELLQESELTLCKYCQRSIRFSDYDDHMSRCKDRGSVSVKKRAAALPRPAPSAKVPSAASKLAPQRPEIGSRVRIGAAVGTVVRIEGKWLVIWSGREFKEFAMDAVAIIILSVGEGMPITKRKAKLPSKSPPIPPRNSGRKSARKPPRSRRRK